MIHFLYGENDFARRRAVETLIQKFSAEFGADSITKIDAGETDAQNLIAEIVNINMFAPRRLIVVHGAENAKYIWEILGQNLSRVPDETDLVVVAAKPDKRTKTYKDLVKVAGKNALEFAPLKPYEMKQWLAGVAREMNVKISNEAVDFASSVLAKLTN